MASAGKERTWKFGPKNPPLGVRLKGRYEMSVWHLYKSEEARVHRDAVESSLRERDFGSLLLKEKIADLKKSLRRPPLPSARLEYKARLTRLLEIQKLQRRIGLKGISEAKVRSYLDALKDKIKHHETEIERLTPKSGRRPT